MRQWALLALLAVALCVPTARAGVLRGVTSEEVRVLSGRTLRLTGMSVRGVLMLEFYVASLWLSRPAPSGRSVLSSVQPMALRLVMLRDVNRHTIVKSFERALRRHEPADASQTPPLQPFYAAMRDVKAGEVIDLTFEPGSGLRVVVGADAPVVLTHPGAGPLVFSIWLGEQPIDRRMREELLTGHGR